MTIAEKLIRAKTDYDEVYEAAYDTGRYDGEGIGYEHGYDVGWSEAYPTGKTAGAQEEYERFWDIYQAEGNLASYSNAFFGLQWTDKLYYPKYDITPYNANTGLGSTFRYSRIDNTRVLIDASKVKDMTSTFADTDHLKTIPRLKVSKNTKFTNTFSKCKALENIHIEGELANTINFKDCVRLTQASIYDIVNAASWAPEYTTSTVATITFSTSAVNKAFEMSPGANDGTDNQDWLNLVYDASVFGVTLLLA